MIAANERRRPGEPGLLRGDRSCRRARGAGGTVPSTTLTVVAASEDASQRFHLEEVTGCTAFPEAHDNTEGETFKGSTADGRVLGMADVHVHTSASTFLGGASHGSVFHKFGVTHALDDCQRTHGPQGVNHHIPNFKDTLFRNGFPPEVFISIRAGREEQVCQLIDDDPVGLLRHAPIEAAQSRLDMGQSHIPLRRRQGSP